MAHSARQPPVVHHIQTCARTGVRLAVYDWPAQRLGGPSDGGGGGGMPREARARPPPRRTVTVVLVHATGFHARCWDCVVAALPPHWRCLCVDQVRLCPHLRVYRPQGLGHTQEECCCGRCTITRHRES
jgi:hypothetical protein